MLTLPALKVQQFAREFFLLNLSAGDVEHLVRFEVLGESPLHGKHGSARRPAAVNWERLEKAVGTSDQAFQRPIIRKKVEELVEYYAACRSEGTLPAIPGAVILTTEAETAFTAAGGNPFLGLLQVPSGAGTLRVLDGQHRLLALAAMLHDPGLSAEDRASAHRLQIPAILFNGLPPEHVVELFVTINAKHTRLKASHLISLSGRQLYGDPDLAAIHDVIRKLNEQSSSPLAGHIKMLGVGPGKIQQAGLAQEMKQVFGELAAKDRRIFERFREEAASFYLVYFRELASIFERAWGSRKSSIKTTSALRAFVQVSPEVLRRAVATGISSRTEAIRSIIAPWGEKIGDDRFDSAGAWRAKTAGGGRETTRLLARELAAALGGEE